MDKDILFFLKFLPIKKGANFDWGQSSGVGVGV